MIWRAPRRPFVVRALLAAVVLLLALPTVAVAQLPAQTSCAITIAHGTPDDVPESGQVSVTISVSNTGNLPATVAVSTAFGASDAGWHVTPAQQNVTVAAGAKGNAFFNVSADKGARSSATLSVSANAACSGPNGLPCPAQTGQCTAQAPADNVPLALQAQQGLRIPGLDALGFPIEYLVAGIVLIVVTLAIVLLLRRRQPAGAMLTCPEPLKLLKPGRGASFPVEARNGSDKPTRLVLAVGPVPEGWSAFLPLPEVQLAARETRGLWLMVRSPETARPGDAIDIEVTATDPATGKPRKLRVRAEVSETGTADG